MSTQYNQSEPSDFLSNVVAPFLTVYVNWVLREAQRKRIERLYFVARDGQILYRLAQVLGAGTEAPELRYLYGSRRAWLLPSITDTELSWRRLVVTPAQPNRLADLCGRLGLDASETLRAVAAVGFNEQQAGVPLTPRHASKVLDQLFQSTELRDMLANKIAASYSLTTSYLEQEGLLDGSSWALVDAGWSLNCQSALKRILSKCSARDVEPKGFYIGLAKDHLPFEIAGTPFAMLSEPGSVFSRRRVVLEHCFTPATHPSTKGYKLQGDRVVPAFSAETRSAVEIKFAHMLQSLVLQYARQAVSAARLERDFDAYKEQAVLAAADFITNPQRSDVTSLCSLQVIADLRHEDSHRQPLCRPLYWRDVAQVALTAVSPRSTLRQPVSLWLEGAATLSAPPIRAAVGAMLAIDNLRNHTRRALI